MPITASARLSRESTGAATPHAPSLVSSWLDAQPRSRIAASSVRSASGSVMVPAADSRQWLGEHSVEHVCAEEREQRLGGRAGVQRHHGADLERQSQRLRRLDPVDAKYRRAAWLEHRQKRRLARGLGHLLKLGMQFVAEIKPRGRPVTKRHCRGAQPETPVAHRS